LLTQKDIWSLFETHYGLTLALWCYLCPFGVQFAKWLMISPFGAIICPFGPNVQKLIGSILPNFALTIKSLHNFQVILKNCDWTVTVGVFLFQILSGHKSKVDMDFMSILLF